MNVHGFHLGEDVTNEKNFIDEIIILIHYYFRKFLIFLFDSEKRSQILQPYLIVIMHHSVLTWQHRQYLVVQYTVYSASVSRQLSASLRVILAFLHYHPLLHFLLLFLSSASSTSCVTKSMISWSVSFTSAIDNRRLYSSIIITIIVPHNDSRVLKTIWCRSLC